MTDSSNHLKHHNQNSKKISKKQPRSHLLSNGINTHEEEKMKDMRNIIQNKGSTRYNQIGMDKIESDSEVDEELDINLEDVKKSNNILEKNQDKIAEISHYLILKNVY